MESNFQELWEGSRQFRQLFLHNGIFRSVNQVDVEKAEAAWWNRYPKLHWMFCNQDGCKKLVAAGDRCKEHMPGGAFPLWRWWQGILYRYMRGTAFILRSHVEHKREYRAYHRVMAEKVYKKIPPKYRVWYADGNPFNLREENIIVLSLPMLAAVKAGAISEATAILLDEKIIDVYVREAKVGRPKKQWVYNMQTIAKAAGIKPERVRQEIHRGHLEPADLSSVVLFCNKIKKVDV